jgi:hypothetical protein
VSRPSGSPFRREAHSGVRCNVCDKLVHDDELAWWSPGRAGLFCSRACCGVAAEIGRQFFERMPRRRARPTERKDDDPLRARYL